MVLGGSGFLGKNIIKKLVQDTGNTIYAYDKYIDHEFFKEEVAAENVILLEADLLEFKQVFNNLKVKIDAIIHLISTVSPQSSMENEELGYQNDLIGTLGVLSVARENKIKIFFFSSGGTVYGNQECLLLHEELLPSPLNHYGIIKLAIEQMLLMNNKVYNTKHLILRIANPYGTKIANLNVGIIPIFYEKIKNQEEILIYGDGNNVRDFIHIDDLLDILEIMLYRENHLHSVYNIGTGVGHTTNEVLEILIKKLNSKPKILNVSERKIDVKSNILDVQRIKSEFGFKAKVNLYRGICKFLETYKN